MSALTLETHASETRVLFSSASGKWNGQVFPLVDTASAFVYTTTNNTNTAFPLNVYLDANRVYDVDVMVAVDVGAGTPTSYGMVSVGVYVDGAGSQPGAVCEAAPVLQTQAQLVGRCWFPIHGRVITTVSRPLWLSFSITPPPGSPISHTFTILYASVTPTLG